MKLSIAIVIFVFLFVSCKTKIDIKPLHPYESTNNHLSQKDKYKFKYFFVDNFKYDSSSLKELETFAYRHLDSNYKNYSHFDFYFYRKGSILNENFRNTDKGELASNHLEDIVCIFRWLDGEPAPRLLFDEGKIVNR